MAQKMIALIMSSMDSEPTLELYRGIASRAESYNYSTQGYVIYPSKGSSAEFNKGEFFLFDTIDFSHFDGLIMMLDTISSEETRQSLVDRILASNLPAITIDCSIAGGYQINTTNYGSVQDMVRHLITVHNCTKINYISGPTDNAESALRLKAYQYAMEEQGLSWKERIFTGTFFVEDGKEALQYFESNETAKDFDAVVCGNDMAAISLISELKKHGYRVPEDVCVTGFDNISDSSLITPSLTTVTKDNFRIGTFAVDLLQKHWNGEAVPHLHQMSASLIFRESCGCTCSQSANLRGSHDILNSFAFSKQFQSYNRDFIEAGTECNTFQDYLKVIEQFILKIEPKHFSLHIMEEYADLFELDLYPHITISTADHVTYQVRNVLLYTSGHFLALDSGYDANGEHIYSDEVYRTTFEKLPAMQYLNSPLHFRDQRIGFVLFANSEFPLMPSLYSNWLSSVNITINSIYNKMLLTKLYQTDSLTQINNRFGMEYYWNKFTLEAKKNQSHVNIIFSDMNGLKKINDQYGHEQGDFAIRLIAKAYKEMETVRLKPIRYGGDEFILLGYGYSDSEMMHLIEKLNGIIEALQENVPYHYTISVSSGFYVRAYDSDLELEDCIKLADQIMYQHKIDFHKNH